jgi:hypothetical protein
MIPKNVFAPIAAAVLLLAVILAWVLIFRRRRGIVSKGVLSRKSPPAFAIRIPEGMADRPKSPGDLYQGGQETNPFSLGVRVDALGGVPFEAWVDVAGQGWKVVFQALGSTSVDILGTKPIEMYEGHQAMEMTINWTMATGVQLTNLNHFILKGKRVITLSSTYIFDPSPVYAIYDTLDLDP